MEIILSKLFAKKLKLLPVAIQRNIINALDTLSASPNIETSGLDYKKLSGSKKFIFYRIRIGDYRIGLKHQKPDIIVVTVGARGDFYKHFPPKN